MDNEIWRDIDGYEGLYQVSNLGRVRSLDAYVKHCRGGKLLRKGRVLKQATTTDGYKFVRLSKNGKIKCCRVNRLVADEFLPNPENLPQVNHKDEVKSNNIVDNLEWCTNKYNCNYGTAIQRRVEKQSKPVLQFTLDGDFIKEYPSINEAVRQTGIYQSNISKCFNGGRKTAGGFKWKNK